MVVFVFVEVRKYLQMKKLKKTRLETYVFVEIWMRCDMNLNIRYFYDRIIGIRATDEYWNDLRFALKDSIASHVADDTCILYASNKLNSI